MAIIQLKSSDGEVIDVDLEIAQCSMTIKTMVEDLGLKEGEEPVPLPNVSAAILKMIIKWATHHKDDDTQLVDCDEKMERRTDDISGFDAAFLAEMDQATLYDLIMAANYLDIKGLLALTCKCVAGMIKEKNPEQIRKTFNIENDFTDEEIEEMRKQNEWCDEKSHF